MQEDSEKVAGFLEDAISRHRVRALASGSTQWGGVTTAAGPDRGARRWPHGSKRERAAGGITQPGTERAMGADPAGDKKKGQIQKEAGPWQSVNHPREKEETRGNWERSQRHLWLEGQRHHDCVQQSHKAVEDWQTPCLKGLSCLKISWQFRFSIMPLSERICFTYKRSSYVSRRTFYCS